MEISLLLVSIIFAFIIIVLLFKLSTKDSEIDTLQKALKFLAEQNEYLQNKLNKK